MNQHIQHIYATYMYVLSLPINGFRQQLLLVVRGEALYNINPWSDFIATIHQGHSVRDDWDNFRNN